MQQINRRKQTCLTSTKQKVAARVRIYHPLSPVCWTLFHFQQYPKLIPYWPKCKGRKWIKVDAELPVIQTVKRTFAPAFNYRKCLIVKRAFNYNETVSSITAQFAKCIKCQVKAHYFNPKKANAINIFLATFQLVIDTNRIHVGQTCASFHMTCTGS